MKKLFLMFMMALFTVSMTSAQTVHESKMFDNVYTTVSVGAVNPTTVWNGVKNVRPEFGIEVGKQVTTLYTTGLEFTAGVNTTGVKTAFDDMSLLWLHKFNVANAIWGYCPDANWDFNVVGGLGWGHDMVIRDNYGVVQAGIEVAYNFNDTWSLIAKPNIEWHHVNDGLNVNHSDLGLAIGVSYKFPNVGGGRGFVPCDEDFLNDMVNQLRADLELNEQALNGQKELNKQLNAQLAELQSHKCVVDTVIIDNTIAPTIGFVINKAELTSQSDVYLYSIAQAYKDSNIIVKGYADVKTGNPGYNMELSKKRAEVVKNKLIEYGATNVSIEALGDTVQPFANNDMNRVAIVIKK
ncbi:MAG: OmpA family protein [Cellulosilyticum sp.]|nr:OmpA family protein [Cellulosilyticum sp.]